MPSEKERLAFYASLRRLRGHFVATMDSFPHPKNRRLTLDEVKKLPRLPKEQAAAADARLLEAATGHRWVLPSHPVRWRSIGE